jgi:murein L,D-transpeptidase YafK
MKQLILLSSFVLGSSALVLNTSPSSSPVKRITTTSKNAKRADFSAGPVGAVSIVIDKSDYELSVFDSKGWYATYPVVFGNNSLEDKKLAGDKNTPEGTFQINGKRVHEKWHRFIAIDYPNKESWRKFKIRKERGEIPASASIGGAIGIHGTWPNEDFVVDRYKNWTLGCICMKRSEVEELYRYTPTGTTVTIRE